MPGKPERRGATEVREQALAESGLPAGCSPAREGRASTLLGLQRSAGNRATRATIGRVAEEPVQQLSRQAMTPAPAPTCQLVMPRLEAEAYLIATSSLGSHVEDRLAAEEEGVDDGSSCLTAPSLEVLDDDAFDDAFVEYATGLLVPGSNDVFTDETARTYAQEGTKGFQDGSRTVLRLSGTLPGHTVHEVLHRLSGTWPNSQGHNVNEGLTDYLTRLVAQEHGIPHGSSYDLQVNAIEELVDLVGIDPVVDAYFGDSGFVLNQALANAGLRHNPLRRWASSVRDGEYVIASMILEGEWFPEGQSAVSQP